MALSIDAQKKLLLAYTEELIGFVIRYNETKANTKASNQELSQQLSFLSPSIQREIDDNCIKSFFDQSRPIESITEEKLSTLLETAFKDKTQKPKDANQTTKKTKDPDNTRSWPEWWSEITVNTTTAINTFINKKDPNAVINGVQTLIGIYPNEVFELLKLLFTGKKDLVSIFEDSCCVSSEVLASIYGYWEAELLPKETITFIKNIDTVVNETKKDIKEKFSDAPNKRLIYVILKYIEKIIELENNELNDAALVKFLTPSNKETKKNAASNEPQSSANKTEDATGKDDKTKKETIDNHLTFKDLLIAIFNSGENAIITKGGHEKISEFLIKLFLGEERFSSTNEEEDDSIEKKAHDALSKEYEKNRSFIYHFMTEPKINVIDFALQLLNSKSLSIFILESIIAQLGKVSLTSNAVIQDNDSTLGTVVTDITYETNESISTLGAADPDSVGTAFKNSDDTSIEVLVTLESITAQIEEKEKFEEFNKKLVEISKDVSNKILTEENQTAVDLWKQQLVKIFKAFEDRPGDMPKTAKAFIQSVQEDEVVTSLDFLYKLTGFYCSLSDGKKDPINEIYFWFITIHEATHSLLEIENELKLHNQILSNQLKAFVLGLACIITIIAVSILYAYQSWFIFGLMIISTLLSGLLSLGWYYFVESANLNPKGHFIASLNQKKALFRSLKEKMQEDRLQFTSFAHQFNDYIQEKLQALAELSTNLTINMPKVIASALMGIAYAIAFSIPLWAYALNAFQAYIMIPAVLIAVIPTICYHWANTPVAYETPKILEINSNMPLKSSGLFSTNKSKNPTSFGIQDNSHEPNQKI